MNEIKFYDLNPSQEVSRLQTKYTLFKRVINILFSTTSDKPLDWKLMEKAYNKVVERNDCLRIRFVKKDKKLMQYFEKNPEKINVPVLTFKTKEEQEAFINEKRKKAIKYMKGIVCEPYFINTYDGKFMVFFKVCHMVLDIYGINFMVKDLFDVYFAMQEGKELPPAPESFEEVVEKDLERKKNEERHEEQEAFFQKILNENPEPYYVGIHGPQNEIWQKQRQKGKRAMKMFFINNDTWGYEKPISKEIMDKVVAACQEQKTTITNFMFYACSIAASRVNGGVANMLPLQLCNCRGSALEKSCAGTKVQSVGVYTTVDDKKSFAEQLQDFSVNQTKLYRRLNFPDQEFEMMLHKTYRSSMLETYYSLTFSFIPYRKIDGITFNIYTNGKGALPCYLALLYDIDGGEVRMCYDAQTKIITQKDVDNFHDAYCKVLTQLAENPDMLIKDLKI